MKINKDKIKGWLIASVFFLIFIVVPVSLYLYFKTVWFRTFYSNYESVIWGLVVICLTPVAIANSIDNSINDHNELTKIKKNSDDLTSDISPSATVRPLTDDGCSSVIGGCLIFLLFTAFAIAGLFIAIKIIKWIWHAV